jgi:hypothetical protein
MSEPLYRIADRDLLRSIAAHEGSFQPPHVVVEGLTEDQAMARPHGLPHSIAEIVSHALYWQDFFLRAAGGPWPGVPEHAAEGWPPVEPGGWERLRRSFLESCDRMVALAVSSPALETRLVPEGAVAPVLERESLGSGLLRGAVHTAHHLGQIVTLRQLMGLWPPPSGGMTW